MLEDFMKERAEWLDTKLYRQGGRLARACSDAARTTSPFLLHFSQVLHALTTIHHRDMRRSASDGTGDSSSRDIWQVP